MRISKEKTDYLLIRIWDKGISGADFAIIHIDDRFIDKLRTANDAANTIGKIEGFNHLSFGTVEAQFTCIQRDSEQWVIDWINSESDFTFIESSPEEFAEFEDKYDVDWHSDATIQAGGNSLFRLIMPFEYRSDVTFEIFTEYVMVTDIL